MPGGAPELVYSTSAQISPVRLSGPPLWSKPAASRPCFEAGPVLFVALMHPSDIIVAIGLLRQRRASGLCVVTCQAWEAP